MLLFAGTVIVAGSIAGYAFVTEFAGGLQNSVLASLETRTTTLLQQLPDTASGPQIAQGSLGVAELAESQDVTQELTLSEKVLVASGPGTDKGRRINNYWVCSALLSTWPREGAARVSAP